MTPESITISLNHGRGKMTIILKNFFPCTASEVRHFDKKCIQSDTWNNDMDQILKMISDHLLSRIGEEAPEDEKNMNKLKKNLNTVELIGGKHEQ